MPAQPANLTQARTNGRLRPEPIRRIVLATDLTDASGTATDHAIALAAALSAGLLVVSVIDPGRRADGLRVDQERSIRENRVGEIVERAALSGVPVEYLIWTGDPGDAIVEAATSERADMIVVGSHGRSGLGRALLGSVSDFVVRHAPCPVMVVKPDRDADVAPDGVAS
jgi:nucleotide-binding universal stress UspA family protein